MATQQYNHPRGTRVRHYLHIYRRTYTQAKAAAGVAGRLIPLLALLLLLPLGGGAGQARAAQGANPSCPTWFSDGAAQCAGQVKNTPTLNPPYGGAWSRWYVCMSFLDADNFVSNVIDPQGLGTYMDTYSGIYKWFGNDHNWILGLEYFNGVLILFDTYPAYYPGNVWAPPPFFQPVPNPAEPPPPCPTLSAPPPCTTCLPQIQDFNFWSVAPTPVISGKATCPDGSVSNCPPSVGNQIQLWVDYWLNAPGTETCQYLGALPYVYQYVTICMWWQPHSSTLTWNFDDETVAADSGAGKPTADVSGGNDSNHPVSHTFEYSSAYDPLRGCVRPNSCSGDLTGPGGAPAFQVTVKSEWDLYYSVGGADWNGTGFYYQTYVNLTPFGSINPYFTETTVVPVSVLSYGSVTTP